MPGIAYSFSGKEIHAALTEAGFSEKEADAAVPVALRSKGQLFSIYPKNEHIDTGKDILITPNPFSTNPAKTISQAEARDRVLKKADNRLDNNVNTQNDNVVPQSNFNGLGNWQNFQNSRFNFLGRD